MTTTQRPLPEKKYFKIGEVADLVGVEPHVLRYWETQFPQVRPHKARSGHRLYRRREVETLLVIRELLHVQRFTIAGARQALRQPGGVASLLPRFFHASPNGEDAPVLDEGADDVVAVDAQGLEGVDLEHALEKQLHGDVPVVELQVEAEREAEAPVRRASPIAAELPFSHKKLGLLEGALADARAIIAILDREAAHDRRLHA